MRHMIHMREIRKAVGHIFGANFRHMHLLYMIHARACGPHGIFLQGIVAPGRRATTLKEREKVARTSSCDINVKKKQ